MPGKSDVNNFEKLEYDPFFRRQTTPEFKGVWLRVSHRATGVGLFHGRASLFAIFGLL